MHEALVTACHCLLLVAFLPLLPCLSQQVVEQQVHWSYPILTRGQVAKVEADEADVGGLCREHLQQLTVAAAG